MEKISFQPVIDFTEYIAERAQHFTVRAWILEQIGTWLADVTGARFFLLAGEPGCGNGRNPRSSAESQLDAWLSTLLPDSSQVLCRFTHNNATHQGANRASLDVSLANLGADPLDVLVMASAADVAQSSELEQRIIYRLPGDAMNYQIVFERDPAWSQDRISFPELLVLARSLRDLLGRIRPLAPQDLI